MHACELGFSFSEMFKYVQLRKCLNLTEIQFLGLKLPSLTELNNVCLIFQLQHPKLEVKRVRVLNVEVKFHFTHSRLFNYFVVTILCRVKTLLVVKNSHSQILFKGLKLLERIPVALLLDFFRIIVTIGTRGENDFDFLPFT